MPMPEEGNSPKWWVVETRRHFPTETAQRARATVWTCGTNSSLGVNPLRYSGSIIREFDGTAMTRLPLNRENYFECSHETEGSSFHHGFSPATS